MRFETEPGEQAQVDWGSLSYIGADGKQRHVWVFDDTGLVASLLRGTGAQGGHRGLHPVPRQCLRVSGRCAPPVPLRQCQGDHAGPRRREATDLEPADAGLRPAGGFRGSAVPVLPSPDQGQGGERGKVRAAQHVAQHPLHRRRRPEPARAGVVRRGGQRAGAWDDPPGAVGDAGRGAAAPGEAARSGHAGAVPAGGPQGVAGRFRQLGGLPVRRALEVGRGQGAGGGAPGHGGDLGW